MCRVSDRLAAWTECVRVQVRGGHSLDKPQSVASSVLTDENTELVHMQCDTDVAQCVSRGPSLVSFRPLFPV